MKKLLAFVTACVTCALAVFAAYAAAGDISPAISVLKRATVMNKCAAFGETVNFTRSDYESTVGADIRYVTVMTLPEKSDGALKLNGINVISGQTVATGSLDTMTFVPAGGDVKEARFTFRACAAGWETTDITCRMVFSAKRNLPPSVMPEGISVYKNTGVSFALGGFDPDGDRIEYIVDGYPVNGALRLKDGTAYYTPKEVFSGNDALTVHAVDEFGGVSEQATYEIKVESAPLVFADMQSSYAHTQAIALAESNAVDFMFKNGKYYFEPQKKVTRIDFTVMLIASSGIRADIPAAALPFADTDKISAGKKAYLAKALELGIAENGNLFRPSDVMTCAEAASFVTALTDRTPGTQAESVLNELRQKGDAPLTREDAARILYFVLK